MLLLLHLAVVNAVAIVIIVVGQPPQGSSIKRQLIEPNVEYKGSVYLN